MSGKCPGTAPAGAGRPRTRPDVQATYPHVTAMIRGLTVEARPNSFCLITRRSRVQIPPPLAGGRSRR